MHALPKLHIETSANRYPHESQLRVFEKHTSSSMLKVKDSFEDAWATTRPSL
jgi:hypothetical protein